MYWKTSWSGPCLFSSLISYYFLSLLCASETGIICSSLTTSFYFSLSYLESHIYIFHFIWVFPIPFSLAFSISPVEFQLGNHLFRNSPFVGWSGACASYWPRTMCLPIVAPLTHRLHTFRHRTEGQECAEFTVSPTSCGRRLTWWLFHCLRYMLSFKSLYILEGSPEN